MDASNTKPVRVECRTCMGHHAYRRPKSAPAAPRKRATATTRAAKAPSARAQAAAATEREREEAWEKRIGGQPLTAFKQYRPTQTFEEGELVRHFKFGDGYIVRIIDAQKVEVMFKEGPRTLAQALDL